MTRGPASRLPERLKRLDEARPPLPPAPSDLDDVVRAGRRRYRRRLAATAVAVVAALVAAVAVAEDDPLYRGAGPPAVVAPPGVTAVAAPADAGRSVMAPGRAPRRSALHDAPALVVQPQVLPLRDGGAVGRVAAADLQHLPAVPGHQGEDAGA